MKALSNLPGQCLIKQCCEEISLTPPFASVISTKEPFQWQLDPPYWGKGLSHVLILDILPSPHVSEHVLQWLQTPQSPSTEMKNHRHSQNCKHIGECYVTIFAETNKLLLLILLWVGIVVVVVGQLWLLQVWVSVSVRIPFSVMDKKNRSFVVHIDPPISGNGLSHLLFLDWDPPPQV